MGDFDAWWEEETRNMDDIQKYGADLLRKGCAIRAWSRATERAARIAEGYTPEAVGYDGYDAFTETKAGIAATIRKG